jgi:hypothetical protein
LSFAQGHMPGASLPDLDVAASNPWIESAWRNASPTNSSTVWPCATAASAACRYNSSWTVNVDMQVPSSSAKSRAQRGAPPSRQTVVKRLFSPVDSHDPVRPGAVYSPRTGERQAGAGALVAMQAGTSGARESPVPRTCGDALHSNATPVHSADVAGGFRLEESRNLDIPVATRR